MDRFTHILTKKLSHSNPDGEQDAGERRLSLWQFIFEIGVLGSLSRASAFTLALEMKICVWRYLDNEKNFPGYHLSADVEGCLYMQERIGDPWDRSSIPLIPPDSEVLLVPNNQSGTARTKTFSKLRIEITKRDEADLFTIDEIASTLTLKLPRGQTPQMLQGIRDIKNGKGDYSMKGEENASLWFWWQSVKIQKANNA